MMPDTEHPIRVTCTSLHASTIGQDMAVPVCHGTFGIWSASARITFQDRLLINNASSGCFRQDD